MSNLQTENYRKWIGGLNVEQFAAICRAFIKVYWKVDDVILVDGKGDQGIDYKIFHDRKQLKIPIQLTTQEIARAKLRKDVVKITHCIEAYNYEPVVYIFYSHVLEPKTIEDLKQFARERSITAEVIDGNYLASIVDDERYRTLKSVFFGILGIPLESPLDGDSTFEKVRIDMLALGDDSLEIRTSLVRAYMTNEVFGRPGVRKDDLFDTTCTFFSINRNDGFCERQLGWLRTNHRIESDGTSSGLKLSDDEHTRVSSIRSAVREQEAAMYQSVLTCLPDRTKDKSTEVVDMLLDLFKRSYARDMMEVNESTDFDTMSEVGIYQGFIKSLSELLALSPAETTPVVKNLMVVCSNNDYLQKIAAGIEISKIHDDNAMDQYRRRQPKLVYLDAPILIHLICVFHTALRGRINNYYNAAYEILEYSKKGEVKISLATIQSYVHEASNHLLEAFRLVPFTRLAYWDELGETANVFHRFFNELKSIGELDDSSTFGEFLQSFGITDEEVPFTRLKLLIEEFVIELLEESGVSIETIEWHDLDEPELKRAQDVELITQKFLALRGDERKEWSIKADAMLMARMFDAEAFAHEPTMLTWDSSFFETRRRYHKDHRNCGYWHLFRPDKYTDHLALLALRVNSEALSRDVLSMIEGEEDIKARVRRMKDVFVRLIDLQSASGIKLLNGIRDIRNEAVFAVNKKPLGTSGGQGNPVDRVLLQFMRYYAQKTSKYGQADFVFVLNNSSEDEVKNILSVLKDAAVSFISKPDLRSSDYERMDAIVGRVLKAR